MLIKLFFFFEGTIKAWNFNTKFLIISCNSEANKKKKKNRLKHRLIRSYSVITRKERIILLLNIHNVFYSSDLNLEIEYNLNYTVLNTTT